jgi:hypothetical protein
MSGKGTSQSAQQAKKRVASQKAQQAKKTQQAKKIKQTFNSHLAATSSAKTEKSRAAVGVMVGKFRASRKPTRPTPIKHTPEDVARKVIRASMAISDSQASKGSNLTINGKTVEHSDLTRTIVKLIGKVDEMSKVNHKKEYGPNIPTPSGQEYYRGREAAAAAGGSMRGGDKPVSRVPSSKNIYHGYEYDPNATASSPLTRPYYDVTKTKQKSNGKHYGYEYDEKFQKSVQNYIKHVHPSKQLGDLNAFQKTSPFSLIDPFRSQMQGKVNYGYADLMRFLGWNYNKNETGILKSKNNPMYQPIIYPEPDARGNAALLKMQQMYNYTELVDKLKGRFTTINNKYMSDPKKYRVQRNKEFHDLIKILMKIIEEKSSPIYLSRFVGDQERPMHQYVHKNLLQDLIKFNQMHKLHLSSKGKHAPNTTQMRLTNKNLK